jgi:hypothetical protein
MNFYLTWVCNVHVLFDYFQDFLFDFRIGFLRNVLLLWEDIL